MGLCVPGESEVARPGGSVGAQYVGNSGAELLFLLGESGAGSGPKRHKHSCNSPTFSFMAEGSGNTSVWATLIRTKPYSEVRGLWVRPEDAV